MELPNRHLTILASVWLPCLALAAAFYMSILRPQRLHIRELAARLEETKRQYAAAHLATTSTNETQAAQVVEKLRSRVADFCVEPELAPNLAFEIVQLASNMGIAFSTMSPQSSRGSASGPVCDRIMEKRIGIGFASPFHEFATLLNALERHRPIVFVESFAIGRSPLPSSDPQARMELAVLVERPQGG